MAAFEKEVMGATEETDPALIKKQQDEYNQMVRQMSRQFGGQQQAGTPVLGMGTAQGYTDAATQAKIDEATRRQQASQKAYELGRTVDTRKTNIAAELNAAIRKRQLDQQSYADKQAQQDRENTLQMQQIAQTGKEKIQQLNFTLYKNQSERNAALRSLYQSGASTAFMANAAANAAVKQQDIDAYFAILKAGLEADFQAAKAWNAADQNIWANNMQNQATNFAQIFMGATEAVTGGISSYLHKSNRSGV